MIISHIIMAIIMIVTDIIMAVIMIVTDIIMYFLKRFSISINAAYLIINRFRMEIIEE